MDSTMGILIYAELLTNIKRISVGVHLTSQPDQSTRAEITHSGSQLHVYHKTSHESIDLPAQVVVPGSTATLPIPGSGSVDFSWRLPVAPDEIDQVQFSPENQAIPWTSVDIEVGSQVECRKCCRRFVQENVIQVWKDLPSENWAEMMEFWHCHKPHDHNHDQQDSHISTTKGYGANNAISAQKGVGFVDLTSFLFAEADCEGLMYSSSTVEAGFDISNLALDDSNSKKFLHVFCGECKTEVGLYNILASSVTLFKWQITCRTSSPTKKPTSSECLSATLIATISRSGSSKSIIAPPFSGLSAGVLLEGQGNVSQALYLWILNSNVVYSMSRVSGKKTALKILFRRIDEEEANKMIESLNSDVQEITMPLAAIESAAQQLVSSSLLLPPRERQFKDWSVGLLERWEFERS